MKQSNSLTVTEKEAKDAAKEIYKDYPEILEVL